jgi:hypothetical protein
MASIAAHQLATRLSIDAVGRVRPPKREPLDQRVLDRSEPT